MHWNIPIEELRELESYKDYNKYKEKLIKQLQPTIQIAMDKTEHEKTLERMKEEFKDEAT